MVEEGHSKLKMSVHSGGREVYKDMLTGDQMLECYHCWYKTKNKLSLEDHMRTHLVERPFACSKCDFRAIRKNHLQQHMKVHVLNLYGCSLCDFKSYDRSSVKRHLNIHSKSMSLHCKICNFRATDQSYLAKHMEAHTGTEYIQCKHCDYKDNDRKGLETHMASHTVEAHACKRCDDTSNDRSTFTSHMSSHTGEKPFACSHCDYKATNKIRIRHHMTDHTGEQPFVCSHCDYKTHDRSSLRVHLTIHTGEKPLKCRYCDYRTNDRDCLTAHVVTHTGEKLFPCDICGFRTSSRNDLRKHKMLKHSEYKSYACEECDFKTASEPAFKNHKRKHSGEKPFGCNQCDYTSYSRANVVSHRKIHGEKTVTCTYCPYSARTNSDMNRHMKVHSMEKKRFKCKECNYRTADKKAFKKHKRVHTGQKPFGCSVCDKTYNRRPALHDHVVKVHARKDEEGSYVCNLCEYNVEIFSTKTSLDMAQHILSSHTALDVPPPTLETAQPTQTTLPIETAEPMETHTIVYTGQKPFACTVCDMTYDSGPTLHDHVVNVHARKEEEGSYTCNMCDYNVEIYTAETAPDMAHHILSSHTTLIVPPTLEDSEPLETAQSFETHTIVYTRQEPFDCTVCGMTYNSSPTLHDHVVNVHARKEEEGSYMCNMCDYNVEIYTAETAPDMAQHILSSHTALNITSSLENSDPMETSAPTILLDNVDYVCNICEHKANNVSDMAKHMLTAHSTSEATATMVVPMDSPMLSSFLASDAPGTQFGDM